MLAETKQPVDLDEVLERNEIKDMVDSRMEKYNPQDTVLWEDVKNNRFLWKRQPITDNRINAI